jgi:hypothetical protein
MVLGHDDQKISGSLFCGDDSFCFCLLLGLLLLIRDLGSLGILADLAFVVPGFFDESCFFAFLRLMIRGGLLFPNPGRFEVMGIFL